MNKKIITEADVMKMNPPQELVADESTIITPAARDKAFFKGIHIVHCSKKKSHEPVQDKIASLDDGDYVLQKRGDQVRLYRLHDNGVFPVSKD